MWTTLRDGMVNLVSRMGTQRDKHAHASFGFTALSMQELEAAYRGSAVAKKIVDQPAEDCAREWREWKANKDEIDALEATERRVNVAMKVIQAKQAARLYGGSAIYIGVNDGANVALPINPQALKKDSLQFLTVLTKRDLKAGPLQLEPNQPGFGLPQFYMLQRPNGQEVRIHPSRLVILKGEETPAGLLKQRDEWGDSILQSVLDAVRDLDAIKANVISLTYEAKVDVIKVPNLMVDLATKGAGYENIIMTRLGLAMQAKGINGTLLLDGGEEYDQKSATFGQLPELTDRFMQFASAASGIPMTILFGMSPAGLNATGDADIRTYYDRVRAIQTLELTPAMSILDEVVICSALGKRPPEVHYIWRPLWQPTDKERAEVGKLIVEAVTSLKGTNLLSPEALAVAVVNALTEGGYMPGLEDAVDEFPYTIPDDTETGLEDPKQAGALNA